MKTFALFLLCFSFHLAHAASPEMDSVIVYALVIPFEDQEPNSDVSITLIFKNVSKQSVTIPTRLPGDYVHRKIVENFGDKPVILGFSKPPNWSRELVPGLDDKNLRLSPDLYFPVTLRPGQHTCLLTSFMIEGKAIGILAKLRFEFVIEKEFGDLYGFWSGHVPCRVIKIDQQSTRAFEKEFYSEWRERVKEIIKSRE